MKLLNIFKSFKNDESGAVTVDWVVLTGAVVGLGIIISTTMGDSIQDAADLVAADVIENADND
jgi:Flp pilus assembly pilin Flp